MKKIALQIVTVVFAIGTFQLSLGNEVDHSYVAKFLKSKEIESWRSLLERYPEAMRYIAQPQVNQVQAANEIDPNSTCNLDLVYTVNSLSLEPNNWALQMIDSSGKLASGVTNGAIRWPGDFDTCQGISAPPSNISNPESESSKGFHGQYCRLTLKTSFLPAPLQIGICVPSSCNENQLLQTFAYVDNFTQSIPLLGDLLKNLTTINDLTCMPDPKDFKYSVGAICCIILVAFSLCLVATGTLYDAYLRIRLSRPVGTESVQNLDKKTMDEEQDTNSKNVEPARVVLPKRGKLLEIVLAFSAITNATSILDTSQREGQLNCIHGIRFLSLAWIILGHTISMSLGSIDNAVEAMKVVDSYWFQAMLQATFSVDTFFLMSGFLVTYLFTKDKGLVTCSKMIYFYVHRYLRLTPVYAIVILVFATWYNYIGDGPFWRYSDQESNGCTKYWWQNILYINNLTPGNQECMGWGWYLANDMQFYVISPLFLIPLKSPKYRIVGLLTILALLLSSWITTGVLSRQNEVGILFQNLDEKRLVADMDLIYTKPWTRIGPYLIGALLAYCFTMAKSSNRKIHWLIVVVGWCLAIISNVSLVYGLYKANPNLDTCAFYNSIARSVWAMSVAWVIFACLTNNAGPVNRILSWSAWFPLSRLSYCAYFLHPMVIIWYFNTLRETFHFTLTTLAVQYLGFISLTYGAAFLASVFYEGPIIRIEKILRQRYT